MSKFATGTAKLVLGRGLSVAIGFAAAPVIARLFSPSDFGVAGIVQSIGGWVAAFACLSYAVAIPLSTSRSETRALILLCLLLTAGLVVPAALFPLLGSGLVSGLMNEPALKALLWFVPLMFLFGSLSQIARYTCSKEGRFGLLSVSHFAQSNLSRALHIALGLLLGGSALYLLLGSIAATALGTLIAGIAVLRILARDDDHDPSPARTLRDVARRHRQFPQMQLWNSVLNVASHSLPVLLMGACFASSMVGYYSFGRGVLMLPMAVLGTSVAQVFYPQGAVEWNETGSVSTAIHKSIRTLSLICVFPLMAVGLLGALLFETAFGARWHEAGVYAQIMTPWILVVLLSSPISTVFLIRERAGALLVFNIVSLLGRSGALLLGGWLGGARTALVCFSAAGALVYFSLFVVALRLGRIPRRTLAFDLLGEASRAALLVLPAALAYWAGAAAWISLPLLGLAAAFHCAWVYRREPTVRSRIRSVSSRLRPTLTSEATGP